MKSIFTYIVLPVGISPSRPGGASPDVDIHDVMRLLADVGNTNIVISYEVQGKVTLRLKRAAWDLVACTIAPTDRS